MSKNRVLRPRRRSNVLGRPVLAWSAVVLGLAAAVLSSGCKSCREDDESEEEEERDEAREHFWRVAVRVSGAGTVIAADRRVVCGPPDGPSGACGPVLFRFTEGKPPLLDGVPEPGWRLDHWESSIRESDGSTGPRKGPMPDGRYYLNGFGYRDTGELETVTAVFVSLRPKTSAP